jgi:predicted AlkP superfamily phosphohydrolase/phosphomutase
MPPMEANRRQLRPPAGILLLVGILLQVLGACAPADTTSRQGQRADRSGRVVMVGVDGADWRLIEPLLLDGRMPHMARIVREGASGTLLSMEPSQSPALWTTIATGVSPERHGIHGFVVPKEKNARPAAPAAHLVDGESGGEESLRPVTSGMRAAPAFWNILSSLDLRAGVVGWLVTWPAEPVNGFIVSSYLPYIYSWSTGRPLKGTIVEGIPRQTFPEGLIEEIDALKVRPADLEGETVRRFYDPSRIAGLGPEERECVTGFLWSLACDETYRRIGLHLFDQYPVDVFAVYFGGVDVASHRFWKFARPRDLDYGVSPADAEVLGGVIDAYYRYVDDIIGEYLARLGPRDTLVVLSDHGFRPVLVPDRPSTSGHHRLEGVVALRGRGIRPGARIEGARLVDVLPTLLVLLDQPLSAALEGRPLLGAFDPDFIRAHPPRTVSDYGLEAAAAGPDASDLDRNVLERLRSLGYIN